MKRKLHIVLTICLVFMSSLVIAQETEELTVPISEPGKQGLLRMYLLNGSIKVVGHNSKELKITAVARHANKDKQKDSKNGLRKLNNNAVSFTVEEINNTVVVKSKKINTTTDFTIMVPTNFDVNVQVTNNGNIYIDKVNGTIEASNTNGKIEMTDISGSVVADALNRTIKVGFTSIKKNTNMAFSSLNGNIDITFPTNLNANIKAKTDNGNIYTDFDFKIEDRKPQINKSKNANVYKVNTDSWTYGTINGGGPEMLFKTLNGNIYIRSN